MSKFTGKPVNVGRSINDLYGRLSDLSAYKAMVDELPEEQRSRISGINFTDDSVAFDAPGVGQLKFVVDELVEPTRVAFRAEQSPIPLTLSIDLKEDGETSTVLTPCIDMDIPAVVRPFIAPKIQEAADKFGEVFSMLVK